MRETIPITADIALDPSEIEETFIRASGPGGQNVNKVATAVQLRFNLRRSASLPDAVKARVAGLAGSRLNKDGDLIITAARFRTQTQNRADALERLVTLLRQGTVVRRRRRPTRPTLASRRRRLDSKSHRGEIKRLRRSVVED